jgi:hypothetical protein
MLCATMVTALPPPLERLELAEQLRGVRLDVREQGLEAHRPHGPYSRGTEPHQQRSPYGATTAKAVDQEHRAQRQRRREGSGRGRGAVGLERHAAQHDLEGESITAQRAHPMAHARPRNPARHRAPDRERR